MTNKEKLELRTKDIQQKADLRNKHYLEKLELVKKQRAEKYKALEIKVQLKKEKEAQKAQRLISGSYNLVGALSYLPQTFRGVTKLSNCVMRLGYIIDPIPLIDRNETTDNKIDGINSIIFENVNFSYPNAPNKMVIPNFSYEFKKGKSYALVGESGIGKSTIARMLLRFYDPTNGKILINNKDLSELNLPNFLKNVGYVEQEPQILFGTVFENIQYALFNKGLDEVIEASKKAKLHDFVMTLPEGYDTVLGERGFLLSGGQKQRLVIARLFLKNPDLLVLDEATSALDNIVEKDIQSELNELMKNRTAIVIAHRLSTIKEVDEIIVLQKGHGIVQVGNFEQLKKEEGIFQKLYKAGLMN
ncbi:hypothetical protein FQR65_LT15355 [Abscondita terminalis]|nr:hypothetical protein FQR65_LT15355 [Abscondita terminalis]